MSISIIIRVITNIIIIIINIGIVIIVMTCLYIACIYIYIYIYICVCVCVLCVCIANDRSIHRHCGGPSAAMVFHMKGLSYLFRDQNVDHYGMWDKLYFIVPCSKFKNKIGLVPRLMIYWFNIQVFTHKRNTCNLTDGLHIHGCFYLVARLLTP